MTSHSIAHEGEVHHHPTDRSYVRVAIVLTVITIIEVAIYYISALRGVLIPALLVLSTIKFVGVVALFMHLRFDNKLFTWIFVAGLVISLSVMIAMTVMNQTSNYYAPVQLPPSS